VDETAGETVAIIVVLAKLDVKQSLRIRVSFDALYGTCFGFPRPQSRALIHSFNARSDVLISELSVRLWRSCDLVSDPRSLPARSTSDSFPLSLEETLSLRMI
jgi:hypothetical protein